MHGVERAGHAGADFDRVNRHEAADIFILVGHHLLDRNGDGDRRRRRRGLLLVLPAHGQKRRERKQQGETR